MKTASTATKERPILFSGPMVRAILEGRKTQSRRVIRIPAHCSWPDDLGYFRASDVLEMAPKTGHITEVRCPYGKPGDRLWIKERWYSKCDDISIEHRACIKFGATDEELLQHTMNARPRWRSPLHLPRWASRLTLTITDVRVQRLRDISMEDCCAEGAFPTPEPGAIRESTWDIRYFIDLWDSINKSRGQSWESNPWVWALSFTVDTEAPQ